MACPTCDHTMELVGTWTGQPLFWCARCGTVRAKAADKPWVPRYCQPSQERPHNEHEALGRLLTIVELWLKANRIILDMEIATTITAAKHLYDKGVALKIAQPTEEC